jgi:CRP/FNR family transcriptional regulator, cyclic AMP receptor protein
VIKNLEMLKRSDVFGGLGDDQLGRILELARPQVFAEGAMIVEEDQKGGSCYFITAGRVDIEIRPPFSGARGPQKIATIKSGEMFGELSLVDGFLRSATARAVEPTEVMAFENTAMEKLMEEDPRIGYRVMRNIANVLSQRIRTTNMKLRNAIADVFFY